MRKNRRQWSMDKHDEESASMKKKLGLLPKLNSVSEVKTLSGSSLTMTERPIRLASPDDDDQEEDCGAKLHETTIATLNTDHSNKAELNYCSNKDQTCNDDDEDPNRCLLEHSCLADKTVSPNNEQNQFNEEPDSTCSKRIPERPFLPYQVSIKSNPIISDDVKGSVKISQQTKNRNKMKKKFSLKELQKVLKFG